MKEFDEKSYYCSYTANIQWLTANITVLNFCPQGDFMISLQHAHSFMELMIIRSGTVRVKLSQQTLILSKGDLLYLNTKVPHIITSDTDEPVDTFLISFLIEQTEPTDKVPFEWMEDEMLLTRALFQNDYLTAHDTYGCEENLSQLLLSIYSRRRGEYIKIKGFLSNILMAALQAFTPISSHPRFEDTLNQEFSYNAIRIINYIHEHFTDGLTLSSVADTLHYSPRQCQRIIQEVMGVSFSTLVLELQLSHAKMLLRSSNDSLESISEQAGFSSSRSLYRHFKEQEGISPQQYRKNQSSI